MHKFQLHRRPTCGQTQHTTNSFQRRSKCSSATKGMCGSDNHAGNIDAFCGFIWGVWNPAEDCTILRRSASWRYVRNNTEQSRVPQTEHRSFLFLQAQESHAFFCKPQACSSSFIIGLATSNCRLPTLDPSSTRVVPTIYNTHTFQTSPHFNLMPWSNPMH